ncbi:MAG: hypothetical protein ACLGI7_14535 [Gammaproteobacteria bacterium]
MKHLAASIALVVACAPCASGAQEQTWPRSTVDALYSYLSYDVGDDIELSGPGAALRFTVGEGLGFLTGEYQYSEPSGRALGERFEATLKTWRAGAGVRVLDKRMGSLHVRGEYVDFEREIEAPSLGEAEDDQDGFGGHVGGIFGIAHVLFWGEAGYIRTDESDGYELRTGAGWQPGTTGFFVEYRLTDLQGDDEDVDETFGDIRVGVRSGFN